MRLFIALSLTPEVHSELDKFIRTLQSATGDSVRWVPASNIHLTLKFLGETGEAQLKALTSTVGQVAGMTAPFDFSIRGTGVFPAWNHPRVAWVGVDAPGELTALQAEIDSATRELGFPSEGRPFSPHLTLGRVNGWMSPNQLKAMHTHMDEGKDRLFGSVHARQVVLFKSTLKPGGAVYSPAAVLDFAGER